MKNVYRHWISEYIEKHKKELLPTFKKTIKEYIKAEGKKISEVVENLKKVDNEGMTELERAILPIIMQTDIKIYNPLKGCKELIVTFNC